jgi:hypothetical protein
MRFDKWAVIALLSTGTVVVCVDRANLFAAPLQLLSGHGPTAQCTLLMSTAGGAHGNEGRYPAREGDAFFIHLNTAVGFYNGSQSGSHNLILAVCSRFPIPKDRESGPCIPKCGANSRAARN